MLVKPSTALTGVPSGRVRGGKRMEGAEDEARTVDQIEMAQGVRVGGGRRCSRWGVPASGSAGLLPSAMRATMPRRPALAQRAPRGRCHPSPTASHARVCPQRFHRLCRAPHLRLLRGVFPGGRRGAAVLAPLPAGARPLDHRGRADAGAHAQCCALPWAPSSAAWPTGATARAARSSPARSACCLVASAFYWTWGFWPIFVVSTVFTLVYAGVLPLGGDHRAPHGLGGNRAMAACGSGARSPTCWRRR